MVCFKTLQELRRLSSLKRIEKQKHVFFCSGRCYSIMLLLRVSLQEFGVTQSHTSKNMNIIVAAEFPPVELFFSKRGPNQSDRS